MTTLDEIYEGCVCRCGHSYNKHFAPGMKCLGSRECQCHVSRNAILVEFQEKVITGQAAEIARLQSELNQLSETVITFEPLSVPDTHYMAFRFGDRAWGFGKTKEEAREALQAQESK